MTIDNLKCFILVAENLSFARTAEALHISQPAVTKQINTLEKELGVSLFVRSTRHVELTAAGMSFYKDAKEIMLKSEIAVQRVQAQNKRVDSIRIGLSNTAILSYLSPVLHKYHLEYPDFRPDIEVLDYKIILRLFLERKLDIIFYYKENTTSKGGICFKELEKDSLVCLVPSNHPLASKETVSICDLENQKMVACNPLNAPISMADFQQSLIKQINFESIFYCNTVEIAHCMVSAGMGISILPQLLCPVSKDLVSIPLEKNKSLSFGVFYHKGNNLSSLNKFLPILNK